MEIKISNKDPALNDHTTAFVHFVIAIISQSMSISASLGRTVPVRRHAESSPVRGPRQTTNMSDSQPLEAVQKLEQNTRNLFKNVKDFVRLFRSLS